MEKYKVLDWAGNEVGSPIFNHFDDASDWLDELINKVYGDLSDDDYDLQRQEYVIHDVQSDEDRGCYEKP